MQNDSNHTKKEISGQSRIKALRLKDLNFGFASADFEASHDPDLLLRGFVDPMNLVDDARNGKPFLFLGHKGSGKSALGEHLRLLSVGDSQLFIKFFNIADISFSTFSQIMKGKVEPEARYPTVWSWLLIAFLLDSFHADEGSNCSKNEDIIKAIKVLKNIGILPDPKLSNAISLTSDKTFSIKLGANAGIFGGEVAASFKSGIQDKDLPFFVERLKLVVNQVQSSSRHLLIIDGFDDLIRRGHLQYDALGALIFEVNRLNIEFARIQSPAKIIVLCRTDLFERLPGPNKNKIRQTAAIHIDWTQGVSDPKSSNLIRLINQRAGLTLEKEIDVFNIFFPSSISLSGRVDVRSDLLEYTRELPRDMVVLFKHLQDMSGDGRMTSTQIFNALTAYSREYFLPEIKDELDGYIDGEHINVIFQILGSIRKKSPDFKDIQERAQRLRCGSVFNLHNVLETLFDCGAIGNIYSAKMTSAIFKYKNRHVFYNSEQRIIVHKGLWRALNLSW